ncbi:MAG: hypothetical protein ABEI75_02240 [Halobaculum sp.]
MNRRTFVLGASATVTGVAGCAALSARPLGLTVFNQTDDPYTVEIAILDPDRSSRSEARLYDGSISLGPGGQARRERVFPRRPALVRYSVYEDNSALTDEDHVHYYPSEDTDRLAFDIDPPGVLHRRL